MENVFELDRQRKALCEATNVFLRQNFSPSPKSIKVLMDQDLVVIRVDNFLCRAEIEMGKEKRDTNLIHEMYSKLFDRVKAALVDRTEQITSKEVISSQININLETEVCIMNFFLSPKPRTERPQLALLMAPRD
jgi:uncharacterized protein YbcI